MANPEDFYFNIYDDGLESYIKSEDEEGNFTLLSPSGLSYFDSKTGETVKYNKKIAFGDAEHGEYVDLSPYNFDSIPSIDVNPRVAPIYSKDYQSSTQRLEVGYSELSKNGFRVKCQLNTTEYIDVIPDENLGSLYIIRQSSSDPVTQDTSGYYLTETGCTDIEVTCEISIDGDYGETGNSRADLSLYRYDESGNHEFIETFKTVEHGDKNNNLTFTGTVSNLTPDKYRIYFEFEFSTLYTMQAWLHLREIKLTYGGDTEILTGEVNWLATE